MADLQKDASGAILALKGSVSISIRFVFLPWDKFFPDSFSSCHVLDAGSTTTRSYGHDVSYYK